ncbi:SDR family oxidoreductase [Bacillus shivajii]|uniref:SDR family oxidoreductase n=1 Tax=Bacillus shivajii TaxID=1983719 RepID=UPI001CFB3F50|nr:SDR family oxidoreductase [Bacillus shivajii]UCZ53443.1 SDR family oxidoreductase [Bacillus shivajii]
MKVFVIGANGQIGRHLVRMLQESNEHTVKAMVRKQEQKQSFEQSGVEAVVADLEGAVGDLAQAMKGFDAVVFTAGSGGQTGADKTLLIDLDGAVKTVEAAEKAGVDRYVMVSAHQAHNRDNWNEKIRHYYVAKHYADRIVEDSRLKYTVIRPGGLLNEPGKGKVTAAENLQRGSIPREDVAKTIVASLNDEHTQNRSFDLISGEDDIEEAVKKI